MDILFKELNFRPINVLYKPFQKSLRFKIQNLETLVKKKFLCVGENTVVNI